MSRPDRPDESQRWLEDWGVDKAAQKVFLTLSPESQRTIREMGGLKNKYEAAAILMGRIHKAYGHVYTKSQDAGHPEAYTYSSGIQQ